MPSAMCFATPTVDCLDEFGRSRIISRQTITATKVSALMKKANPSPVAATTSPASAGPNARAPLNIAELRPMALVRSSLPSTMSTVKAWRAGMSTA